VLRSTALPRALAALLFCAALLLAPRPARAETVHTVAKGQTLGAIAKRYRISVPTLREANGLAPNARIFPGTRLIIPDKSGEKPGKAGDKGTKAAPKERETKDGAPSKGAKASPTKGKGADKTKPNNGEPGGRAPTKAEKAANEVADARQYDGKAEADQKPKRPGLVRLRRGEERYEIQLLTRKGRLVAGALPKLRHVLRHAPSAKETLIDPRLATLLGMVSNHFGGRTIEVVSGFRPLFAGPGHASLQPQPGAGGGLPGRGGSRTPRCATTAGRSAMRGWATTPTARSFTWTYAR
jgi:murein DD-endopeptidase MepM/ murein hydrolase activator NlpD